MCAMVGKIRYGEDLHRLPERSHIMLCPQGFEVD